MLNFALPEEEKSEKDEHVLVLFSPILWRQAHYRCAYNWSKCTV